MKANLIYNGPEGRKGFRKGEKYTLFYEVEAATSFIVLEAGARQVVYRNWNDFHSEWRILSVSDEKVKHQGSNV